MKFGTWKNTHKQTITCAIGAAVGAITPPLIRKFLPGQTLAGTIPAPWCNNDVFYPIVLGTGGIIASMFIKKTSLQSALIGFGIVNLLCGILRGALPEYGFLPSASTRGAGLRLATAAPRLRAAMANATPTGIPVAKVLS
ncbi:MAG: hypothetical protein KKB31_04875 [Nanoarchaeota archaeon]|nr:hypothetical protein [Nanoarchaeota archaeon]